MGTRELRRLYRPSVLTLYSTTVSNKHILPTVYALNTDARNWNSIFTHECSALMKAGNGNTDFRSDTLILLALL